MVVDEEQLNPQVTVSGETPVAPITPDNSELLKNYESLVKQQQEQIQQLIKQQELNAKVNKQLGEALKQHSLQETTQQAPKEHWVDEVINKDFVFQSIQDYSNETLPAGQLADWYTRYLKEVEGCNNDQVANRMKSIFDFLETGKQDSQPIPNEHTSKMRPIPHEIKYR